MLSLNPGVIEILENKAKSSILQIYEFRSTSHQFLMEQVNTSIKFVSSHKYIMVNYIILTLPLCLYLKKKREISCV